MDIEQTSRPSDDEPTAGADEMYGYGRSWREIADEMEGAPSAPRVPQPQAVSQTLGRRLCNAERADEALGLVLEQAVEQLTTCVLFRIKDGAARVWRARTLFGELDVPDDLALPLDAGSLLGLLADADHYRGPAPDAGPHREFFARLGRPVPREFVLVPITVGSRRIGILYGDAGEARAIAAPVTEQLKLARTLGLALNLILIKNKIRQLAGSPDHDANASPHP